MGWWGSVGGGGGGQVILADLIMSLRNRVVFGSDVLLQFP